MDSALANFRRGEAPWQERESGTLASDADEVEPDSALCILPCGSSYVLTLRFQRHSEKDPKHESRRGGDENQNGVGHCDGCKQYMRCYRLRILDDEDCYQNGQD
jgi:hypothetical protein